MLKIYKIARAIYEAAATTLATLLTRTPDRSITRVPLAGESLNVTPAIRVVISIVRSKICSSRLFLLTYLFKSLSFGSRVLYSSSTSSLWLA